jgi:type I restriction enzyme M protein
LLEDFGLEMVVSLPPGAFAPYSDVKTALLIFERPGPTKEILYHELPLPAGLKKFAKGNPISDKDFAEARETWTQWSHYRCGEGPRPETTLRTWIESAEFIAARDYDLSAKNPSRPEDEALLPPVEITASLLEKSRSFHEIVERLNALVGEKERV